MTGGIRSIANHPMSEGVASKVAGLVPRGSGKVRVSLTGKKAGREEIKEDRKKAKKKKTSMEYSGIVDASPGRIQPGETVQE
jgi:hypothetical protein